MGRCDRRERKSKAIRSRRRRTAYIALWGRGPNSDRMDACCPRLAPFLLLYSNFVARQRPTLSTLATSVYVPAFARRLSPVSGCGERSAEHETLPTSPPSTPHHMNAAPAANLCRFRLGAPFCLRAEPRCAA